MSNADREALLPSMRETSLARAEVLFEPQDQIDTLYFPGAACISVVVVLQDGTAVESMTIGRESAVGLLDAISDQPTISRMFAQIGGSAIRLPARAFRRQLAESPELLRLTLEHARATSIQSDQGVACNVAHDVRQRLARWLLMTQDRTDGASFRLTQDYMAAMTGVQRTTVSAMAATFKRERLIDYRRGDITILDRRRLIETTCECYEVISRQFNDLKVGAKSSKPPAEGVT